MTIFLPPACATAMHMLPEPSVLTLVAYYWQGILHIADVRRPHHPVCPSHGQDMLQTQRWSQTSLVVGCSGLNRN